MHYGKLKAYEGFNLNNDLGSLKGKRIFVTGHTGFTGSWASIWLHKLGARSFGFSLLPEAIPNLYSEAKVSQLLEEEIGDIRDFGLLRSSMERFQPDLVLHLAAQPLVRRSYFMPRDTFEINVQGTINVLEAARTVSSVKGVLCITTDKVYKNSEAKRPFVETDELGGKDPYSASKAAAEIAISSYREAFGPHSNPLIAVARGGNIVGGGDWSDDRLIPDFVRSVSQGSKIKLRYPDATRPWQHVLALVEGYFSILKGLTSSEPEQFAQAFNLGPTDTADFSVAQIIEQMSSCFGVKGFDLEPSALAESATLSIDSTKAKKVIGWSPKWSTEKVIEKTAEWYLNFYNQGTDALFLCQSQIEDWTSR